MTARPGYALVLVVGLVALGGGAAGCAAGNKQLATPHYTLTHPDFWKVKQTASKDGDATVIVIPQYGEAVIDSGAGAMAPSGANYESVTADVEVRLYTWSDPGVSGDATEEVKRLLMKDDALKLTSAAQVVDNPPECGMYPKKYNVFGAPQTTLDLVSRPGFRTALVGAKGSGFIMAAVARVEYEQDPNRFCHNLNNMRTQFQTLLDGLKPASGGGAGAGAPPATPSAAPPAEPSGAPPPPPGPNP
jgi:hypothetical protein